MLAVDAPAIHRAAERMKKIVASYAGGARASSMR